MPNDVIAMIPARIGSTRLKMKNLALIDGMPLVYYAISAAKNAKVFKRIILNADAGVFEDIASRYGIELYLRPPSLGGSEIKSDAVVADFMESYSCDAVAWINPIAPFQTGSQISQMIKKFFAEKLDTLHTVKREQVHAAFQGTPINFSEDEIFARTQDLKPVEIFAYSLMMWRSTSFLEAWRTDGRAFFVGKVGYFDVGKMAALLIKTRDDLLLADSIMRGKSSVNRTPGAVDVQYDQVVRGLSLE